MLENKKIISLLRDAVELLDDNKDACKWCEYTAGGEGCENYICNFKWRGRDEAVKILNRYGTVDCDECPHRSETCLCDLSDNDDPNCPLLKKEGEEE